MICFLTSSFLKRNDINDDISLDTDNGFVNKLKEIWPKDANLLIIASDPDSTDNQKYGEIYAKSFSNSLKITSYKFIDHKNMEFNISESNVIILCGGHVPTQNNFLKELNLKEKLKEFKGILIGLSAGSMNCEEEVYAPEEIESDFTDGTYNRYLEGLGIINKMIIPHYVQGDENKDFVICGKSIYKDIYIPDSYKNDLLFIEDGTYIISDGNSNELYGNAYLLRNGIFRKICNKNEILKI